MLNERLSAAKIVATSLKDLEESLDDTLICAAAFTSALPKARRTANLSPVVGQDAIALSGEVMAAIHHARAVLVEAHGKLAEVRNDIGLTPRMTGDLWKLVDEKKATTTPDLKVVG
jgi:hypothetical protein